MDSRHAATLVVALVAVLAGCNVGPTTATPTVTPAPGVDVTTAPSEPRTAADAAPLPPGVTATRLTDVRALFAADARALAGDGYVAEVRIRGSRAGDTGRRTAPPAPGRITRTVRVGAGGDPTLLTVARVAEGERRSRAHWVAGNRSVERLQASDAVPATVAARSNATALAGNPALGRTARDFVAVGNWVTARRAANGTTVLRARNASARFRDGVPRNLTGYEGRLVVDERDRLRWVTVDVEVSDSERFHYRLTYALRQVGNVTVARPEWVAE
jgi:hypothetical protein